MGRYISAVRQYLTRRGKNIVPIVLGICTVIGGAGVLFSQLSLLGVILFFQTVILLLFLDFSVYIVSNYGEFFYKFQLEREVTKYIVNNEEIQRSNIDENGNFIPRALYANSTHTYVAMPLGAKMLSVYHEFRRSENSALKWNWLDVEQLENSFNDDRDAKFYDKLKVVEYSPNLIKIRLQFNPPVELSERAVKYEFIREYSDAQFLTREDIAKAIENGNISELRPFCIEGRRIIVETDDLYISVEFPTNYNPINFGPMVTSQGTIASDIQKQLKITETRENEFVRAEMHVPKHLIKIGFVYSIIWSPPSINDIKSK